MRIIRFLWNHFVKCVLLDNRGCFGGDDDEEIPVPEFFEDPLVGETQEKLSGFGTDILAGKLPDFFSTLGKTGTPQFEEMLGLINRDTAKAVNENLARRKISRSGVGLSTIAKATSDVGVKMRWQDFLRAQGEKAGLLGTGLSTLEGVRSSALNLTGQRNKFSFGVADIQGKNIELKQQKQAQEDAMWQQIMSSAVGAAAIFATGGAAAPLVLGSASAGGGVASSMAALNPGTLAAFGASSIRYKKNIKLWGKPSNYLLN